MVSIFTDYGELIIMWELKEFIGETEFVSTAV